MQAISSMFNQKIVIDEFDLDEVVVKNALSLFDFPYSDGLIPAKYT